ncbi:MAG: UDP-N-acetylmuramoyl-tripeptide--D-alanyl-D-alanine ligase [Anaerolineaceae bacterium]|nr:UDP-N-acetylmuramoyl-tripeptide--D-alanyl-D-alanine ligase [Anaerolineaceae bacterium]
MEIRDLITSITGEKIRNGNVPISEFLIDSRASSPQSLFVALPGDKTNGHQFVDHAFSNGASFALIDQPSCTSYPIVDLRMGFFDASQTLPESPFCFLVEDALTSLQTCATWWRSKFNIRVVGISGSVGKSSTKELTASLLSRRFITLKSQGNMNNEIGLPLSVLKLTHDVEVAVLEMGFYVLGEIKLLCEIAKPQIGVITNIGTVHAERAGSQEVIAQGKGELIESLPSAPEGVAILNYDDPFVKRMAGLTKAKIFNYGLTPKADLWADEIVGLGLEGIRCRLHYKNEILHVKAPLIGRHSVYTLLRAAAVAVNEGMSWDWIIYALQSSKVQLRLTTVKTTNGAMLIDDTYNASPPSTLAALNLLHDLEGRKVAVLGDMMELGQYEQQGHEMVGIRAAEVADELILIGERSKITANAAISVGFSAAKIHWFINTSDAIEYLATMLKEGDTTLIKGSHSMQMDKIVTALEDRC